MSTATANVMWEREFTRARHTFDPEHWELLDEHRPVEPGEHCILLLPGEAPDGLPILKAAIRCPEPYWIVRPKAVA